MKRVLRIVSSTLAICGFVSAVYATCYRQNSTQYCVVPGSIGGYHTYMSGDPCYGQPYPPIYAYDSIDLIHTCLTWQSPYVTYAREYLHCSARVKWTDCFTTDQYEYWFHYWSYYGCENQTQCP